MKRIAQIQPVSEASGRACHDVWSSIAKPLGSFGILEEMVEAIAAVQETADVDISRRRAVIFCADNGVVAEDVTQCSSDVTAASACAIAEGTSNINALAAIYHTEVLSVDMGILSKPSCPKLLDRRIAAGTGNIAKEPAMTRAQAEAAILAGMELAEDARKDGVKILLTGEMGIGNTTTASAVASVLLGLPAETVTGRGAGLSSEGLERKIRAVREAVRINAPDPSDALDVLAKVGGLDIAGMTGLFLGGAYCRIPVVIDGVISAAAAVLAAHINPLCRQYMLPSHTSQEPAAKGLLERLGLHAPIQAGLRLGEGTGGILLLPLLDGTLALYRNSHRFETLGIERYEEQI